MLFRERLTVPIIWWALAGLFSFSVLLAVGAYLGPVWGVGTSVATMLVAAAIFGSASLTISVDAKDTHIGHPRRPRRSGAVLVGLDPTPAPAGSRTAGRRLVYADRVSESEL